MIENSFFTGRTHIGREEHFDFFSFPDYLGDIDRLNNSP